MKTWLKMLQARAQEHLERLHREMDEKRKSLGVEDEMAQVEGVTMEMMVRFGENEVKSVEDLAYCATDDLTGWSERKEGETVRYDGILTGMDISAAEAEAMIMRARVMAGIISEEDLLADQAEAEAAEAAEAEAEETEPTAQEAAEAVFDTPSA